MKDQKLQWILLFSEHAVSETIARNQKVKPALTALFQNNKLKVEVVKELEEMEHSFVVDWTRCPTSAVDASEMGPDTGFMSFQGWSALQLPVDWL